MSKAISLAKFFPKARIYATDISKDALDVAKINCHTHNVDQIVNLICLDSLKGFNEKVDLVVTNPPYLSKDEMLNLFQSFSFGFPNIISISFVIRSFSKNLKLTFLKFS